MIPRSAIVLASAILAGAAALALAQDHAEPRADAAASAPSPAPLGAIGRLLLAARPGDTVLVPEGVYAEHLRIDKPVSLIAAGRVVIDGQGLGDIVEISAPDTTLRGFVIRNTGIDLDHENAAVRVLAPRATIEANTLDDVLFGIDLRDAPDCRIIGNTIGGKDLDIARRGDGLRLWRSDRALIERNR
ncbi:MAG TPA: hypothetical protein VNN12_00510, partial [Dehalococcoidia bacterium]|nr:hypothetical protein [Dehalococcoidia bacterium]